MLNLLRRQIWRLSGIAIAAAVLTPTAWAGEGPDLTDHTAQDPKPPWKDPPGDGYAPFDPNGGGLPAILPSSPPLSDALREFGSYPPQWTIPGSFPPWPPAPQAYPFSVGGRPVGPVPAPGALALLGLGTLLSRASRRRR
ncbi:MAG: PEP-CTERM sorting domain-containing protein [Phycisphaerales bacterium]|nr:MAG: PEP-CTERM sorting domain-containing protein [Phycisphaerales bacterium]